MRKITNHHNDALIQQKFTMTIEESIAEMHLNVRWTKPCAHSSFVRFVVTNTLKNESTFTNR